MHLEVLFYCPYPTPFKLAMETNCLPEAVPQTSPHQYAPISEIRDNCAVNVKEDNDALFERSPITGQILPATALAVTPQDTVASGTCKLSMSISASFVNKSFWACALKSSHQQLQSGFREY